MSLILLLTHVFGHRVHILGSILGIPLVFPPGLHLHFQFLNLLLAHSLPLALHLRPRVHIFILQFLQLSILLFFQVYVTLNLLPRLFQPIKQIVLTTSDWQISNPQLCYHLIEIHARHRQDTAVRLFQHTQCGSKIVFAKFDWYLHCLPVLACNYVNRVFDTSRNINSNGKVIGPQ